MAKKSTPAAYCFTFSDEVRAYNKTIGDDLLFNFASFVILSLSKAVVDKRDDYKTFIKCKSYNNSFLVPVKGQSKTDFCRAYNLSYVQMVTLAYEVWRAGGHTVAPDYVISEAAFRGMKRLPVTQTVKHVLVGNEARLSLAEFVYTTIQDWNPPFDLADRLIRFLDKQPNFVSMKAIVNWLCTAVPEAKRIAFLDAVFARFTPNISVLMVTLRAHQVQAVKMERAEKARIRKTSLGKADLDFKDIPLSRPDVKAALEVLKKAGVVVTLKPVKA